MAVTIGLPLVIFLLFYLCNDKICLENPLSFAWNKFLPSLSELYPTKEAVHMYIGWMLLHVVLERILPGEIVEGVELENGKRLKYTLSGHLQFWVVIFLMGHSVFNWDRSDWDWNGVYRLKSIMPLSLSQIYDHYVPLITVSIIGSALLSVYLYATSFLPGRLLAKGGDSGNVIYDFFIGRELNPRLLGIDLKEFCELRPGLIGWLVINLGMACKQYQRYRSVSFSMVLVCAFQGLYVWDALYMEKAILTTMDITTDGFGYMLAFGDLSWVPFIYSLQARYLVDHDPALPLWQIALVTVVHFTGLYIFRSANSEKDAFRRDPSAREVAHLSYLQTKVICFDIDVREGGKLKGRRLVLCEREGRMKHDFHLCSLSFQNIYIYIDFSMFLLHFKLLSILTFSTNPPK